MNCKKLFLFAALIAFSIFCSARSMDSCLELTKVMNNVDDKELLKLSDFVIFQTVDSGCKDEADGINLYRIFKLSNQFESMKNFVLNRYPNYLDEDFIKVFKIEYCVREPKNNRWVFRGDNISYVVLRANGDLFARYKFNAGSCN